MRACVQAATLGAPRLQPGVYRLQPGVYRLPPLEPPGCNRVCIQAYSRRTGFHMRGRAVIIMERGISPVGTDSGASW